MADHYTKCVLTIIAVCLGIIAFRQLQPIDKAQAQTGPVHVIIDSAAQSALQLAGPLQVTVRGQ
jgi:hypothetical protein